MKTWEMIKMLEKNPNLRFTCENNKSGAVVTRINKRLICLLDNENTWGYEFIFEKDWQLVRTPVTWQEAIQAWIDGKTVICEISGTHFEYDKANSSLIAQDNKAVCRSELIEGTWYIEE